jgi:large subunit ribosomal protein L31
MKADIHPDYHEINIVMTDGTQYKTRSTWGKEGDTLRLDIDPLSHPAWLGGVGKVIEKGQLDKFESRYGSFLSGANASQKTETKTDEKK